MTKRPVATLLAVAALLAGALIMVHDVSREAPADRLHHDAFVFDAHCDTVMRIVNDGADLGVRSDEGHIDLPRLREGGVDAQVFAMWVAPRFWPDRATARALEMLEALEDLFRRHPDRIALARTARDAEAIAARGKVAAFLGLEGGHAIEDSLDTLRRFHARGVRLMTLTWMKNTNWADGSGDTPRWHGLNDLGREIVREMNRLGMVIDVSHASDETFRDVLELTTRPVLASHSCCRALCDYHRNLDDEMLRALARNGGVLALNYFNGFLDPEVNRQVVALWEDDHPELDALAEQYRDDTDAHRQARRAWWRGRMARLPEVPLERLLQHIDHAVEVAGIDHVGLGSDFDGVSLLPVGLRDTADLPRITAGLRARGYRAEEIRKILGGNVLRVFREVIGE